MFFQFSPVRRDKTIKPVVSKNESEEVESLILAPFTPVPKLSFDNVKIGESSIRKLLIKNPTSSDITLYLAKSLPEELNASYSWVEKTIGKGSEVTFEIEWCPLSQEATRHTISFKDSGKLQKDVHIAFTSVPQNKPIGAKNRKVRQKTSPKKSPTKKYYTTRPTRISPTKYLSQKKATTLTRYSPSPKKTTSNEHSPSTLKKVTSRISSKKYSPSPKKQKYPENYLLSPMEKTLENGHHLSPPNIYFSLSQDTYTLEDKENVPSFSMNLSRASEIFVSPKNMSFTLEHPERRGTFVLKETNRENFFLADAENAPNSEFDDSLENVSPVKSPASSINTYRNRPPLIFYNKDNIQPPFPPTKKYRTDDFQSKLNQFSFTPVTTPAKKLENITPTFSTKMENLLLEVTPFRELSPQNKTFELPLSTTLNMSGETYVKGNTSFETYVRGNTSTGTYTKDSSIGDIESLNVSPLTSKVAPCLRQKLSPVNGQNRHFIIDTENIRRTIEANVWTGMDRMELSRIEEESCNTTLKRKSDIDFSREYSKAKASPCGPKDWSRKGASAIRIAKRTSGLNLKKFRDAIVEEDLEKNAEITVKETSTMIVQNPFLLAATNLVDPFMTSNLYVNDRWIDEQERDFKKWLNFLLTPPEELSSEERVIDVARVWQECKKREVDLAPSKETLCSKYHTNTKLNNLREAARALFRSKEISVVLAKVIKAIDSGKLSIRKDKDVHLNLSIKSEIVSLLLSYNPLWLRIGLETIYNEEIPLNSNSDVIGLSAFIANRLLKDPYLIKKFKSIHAPKYKDEFNKFFLKKFLVLVYFLDQAKNRKLIPHDPCLFCKKALVKESKELLLRLARETLSAVGDITKFLKFSGYVVTHTQTYIHEFDYAVNNLGVDLRDGVRLTRIMEIIVMRGDLLGNLRVPAISRLQKVHNMKIVFDSLEKAGYTILYDISPKDIVDGHREKTLSFLWQIIYKFETPLMVKSATTIQTWFRSLPVLLKRRKLERIRLARDSAAKKIQNWYRRRNLSEKILRFVALLKQYIEMSKRERAATKIQSFYKMYYRRRIYIKQIQTIVKLQSHSRGWLVRNIYRGHIKSAVTIQSYVRMYSARKKYCKLKEAASLIQAKYRAHKQMKMEKYAYDRLKSSVIFVQRKFRAKHLAAGACRAYQLLKSAVVTVQKRIRANRLCKEQREGYLELKTATICIQTWYRSIKTMRIVRERFLALKHSVLVVEERYVALKTMRSQQQSYVEKRSACIVIQRYYRAKKLMEVQRNYFTRLKKAACVIQQAFRAKLAMHRDLQQYETLRSATVFVQRKYRANKCMRLSENDF
ncbi:hypothetical protein JTB14_031216 [Gonioctena quinquepunctata]|nr:hypothetical protein JTB14_031216 [Gonioctena quinquepunctata]